MIPPLFPCPPTCVTSICSLLLSPPLSSPPSPSVPATIFLPVPNHKPSWLALCGDCSRAVTPQEIDKANKDKKNKIYPRGFGIEVHFETLVDAAAHTGPEGAAVAAATVAMEVSLRRTSSSLPLVFV